MFGAYTVDLKVYFQTHARINFGIYIILPYIHNIALISSVLNITESAHDSSSHLANADLFNLMGVIETAINSVYE